MCAQPVRTVSRISSLPIVKMTRYLRHKNITNMFFKPEKKETFMQNMWRGQRRCLLTAHNKTRLPVIRFLQMSCIILLTSASMSNFHIMHRRKDPHSSFSLEKCRYLVSELMAIKQYNYLIDEDQTIEQDGQLAHGPDSVISMLDYAFNTFGTGENDCCIHADNCFGQNKNRYVLAYLSWRTMTGRHTNIKYMMQLPGHTRCLIDAGFGTIKKLYRRSNCDTLQHVVDVVQKSAHSNVPVSYDENRWVWRSW